MLVLFLAFGCANDWNALDADGDGWTVAAGDCWDETAPHGGLDGSEIHPDAPDVPYDGVDADCAGDDDFDHDGDGYVTSIWADPVTEGIPSSLPGGDCWDDRDQIEQEFGALPGFPQLTAADVHPGAAETWYDGIDADCDGGDDFDQDADGHPSAFHRDGASTLGDDCFDAEGDAFENPASLAPADVHPDAFDTCYDATDADCDGASDWDCDHDGFLVDADCDDENPDVRPDAIEIWYDGIDQDCDGNDADKDHDGFLALDYAGLVKAPGIQEGDCWDDPDDPHDPLNGFPALAAAEVNPASGVETFYDGIDQDCDEHDDFDADGDLHETDAYADEFGKVGDDCDDRNDAVRPGVLETCATLYDDDCDGDNNDPGATGCTVRYRDDDGDAHYPSGAVSECACDLSPWTGTDEGDCDDTNAAVYDSAPEIVGDEIDEDCDGGEVCYVDADADSFRPDDGTIASSDSNCTDPGEAASALPVGDCDDANADAYPGAPEVCDNGIDEECDGSSAGCTLATPAAIDKVAKSSLDGGIASGFGYAIATGELGGGGPLDMAITARTDEIVYGLLGPLTVASTTSPHFDITGTVTGFGESLAVDGDLDADGDDDVAIGSPFASGNKGQTFLFLGPVSGDLDESDADLIVTGGSNDDQLGAALVTGDWDGDGEDDLAIGASAQDTGAVNAGALLIFLGPVDSSTADVVRPGVNKDDHAARAIASGDVDGDGLDDIAVGVPGSDEASTDGGGVYVLVAPLESDDLVTNAYALYGTVSGAAAGTAVSIPGDVNGDGYDDLWIGAPHASTSMGGLDAGAAYLVMGDAIASGDLPDLATASVAGATGDLAGSATGSAGDFDNDGRLDLFVGAPGSSQLAIFYALPTGTADLSAADLLLEGTPGDDLGFAARPLGDQGSDDIDDLIVGAPATGTAWIVFGAGM